MRKDLTSSFLFVTVILEIVISGVTSSESNAKGNTAETGLNSELWSAMRWLQEYNQKAEIINTETEDASWIYRNDMTEGNKHNLLEKLLKKAGFQRTQARHALTWNLRHFSDVNVKRQMERLTSIGFSALNSKDRLWRIHEVLIDIAEVYPTTTVCVNETLCFTGKQDLSRIFHALRNVTELSTSWKLWHDKTGRNVKSFYTEYVSLSNEAFRLLGYTDTGEYWRTGPGSGSASASINLDQLWLQIKPLYDLLQLYVRKKLRSFYNEDQELFPASGHIPAHLLGDVLARDWMSVYDMVAPYPGVSKFEISKVSKRQKYNGTELTKIVDSFFTSLGIEPLPQSFWDASVFDREATKLSQCGSRVWDLGNGSVKAHSCFPLSTGGYMDTYRLMGGVHYYREARQLPLVLRQEPLPGFIEALGGAVGLSGTTPDHMRRVGLLDSVTHDRKSDINFLLLLALRIIPILSYAHLADEWRWDVFSEATPASAYNSHWWNLRCRQQGISPPETRAERDFDAGADPEIVSQYPYSRYFISQILQFQVHKNLCRAANESEPIHNCDLYGSKDAGQLLQSQMMQGASRPLPETIKAITSQRSLDTGPLLEYFRPLHIWLQSEVSSYTAQDRQLWVQQCPYDVVSGSISMRKSNGVILTCFIFYFVVFVLNKG